MSEPYMDADKIEACPSSDYIENHQASGRPALSRPTARRVLANPSPLGLLSFATGIFLLSMLGVHTRSIENTNMAIGVLLCFGGICQFLSGIMEFNNGNTVRFTQIITISEINSDFHCFQFGATVFPSYGAFNLSFAMSTCLSSHSADKV